MMDTNDILQGINHPINGYKGFRNTLKENANLDDTLANIKHIAIRDAEQVKELSITLAGETTAETARNIWEFIRENLTYQLDTDGIEELRTPARTLHDKIFDCDDATILTSAILINLGIPHEYRIVAYEQKGRFGHIYPVAIDEFAEDWVIDTVPEIPHFNYEEQPIIDLKTININPMELQELSGIEDEPLTEQEIQQDILEEINQPFSLSGMEEDVDDVILEGTFLSGLGEVATEEEADIVIETKDDAIQLLENGILAEVVKAKKSLLAEKQTPTALSQVVNVNKELALMNDVIDMWQDDEREETVQNAIDQNSSYKNFYQAMLMSLVELETQAQSSELDGIDDDEPIFLAKIQEVNLEDLLFSEDDENLQGFFSKAKKGFTKVVKKVGSGVKKVVKAVVRFNPATILIRNAILLTLKLNLFNLSGRFIYGYLNQQQAQAQNLDLNEWRKLVNAKSKAEGFFTKIGGKSKNFKKAIITGRARKKTGVRLSGIGELGAVAAASGTAAASGFIVFAKKILSSVNPVKLFKKVATKIKEKRASKNASRSSLPSTATSSSFVDAGSSNGFDFEPNSSNQNSASRESLEDGSGNEKIGFIQKVKNFVMKHKKKILLVGITGIIGIVFLLVWHKTKKKKKNQLRGIKAAKTRARNRRSNLKGIAAPKRSTTTKRKSLGRGNTRVIKTPVRGRGKTRVSTQSSGNRLSLMHAKAKQLQKKHPKTKYSNLLKMAAKQI